MRAVEPGQRSEWQTFLWWERRRLGYNGLLLPLALACGGLASMVARHGRGTALGPREVATLVGLVVAIGNVGYTFGWLTESRYRRARRGQPASALDERVPSEAHAHAGVRLLMEAGLGASAIGALAFGLWYGSAAT